MITRGLLLSDNAESVFARSSHPRRTLTRLYVLYDSRPGGTLTWEKQIYILELERTAEFEQPFIKMYETDIHTFYKHTLIYQTSKLFTKNWR